jgi:hypothetical protein
MVHLECRIQVNRWITVLSLASRFFGRIPVFRCFTFALSDPLLVSPAIGQD